MIKCKKCNYQPENESELSLHHLHPKIFYGTDKDGRKYVCKKHHLIIHLTLIPCWIKSYTEKKFGKEEVIKLGKFIKEKTFDWLKKI